jgi:hypothetical protein
VRYSKTYSYIIWLLRNNCFLLQRIFQKGVFESKVLCDSRKPASLVLEIHIGPLFVLFRRNLRFLMALEPGHVLLLKPPTLLLQFLCCFVLWTFFLCIIKDEEQADQAQLFTTAGAIPSQIVKLFFDNIWTPSVHDNSNKGQYQKWLYKSTHLNQVVLENLSGQKPRSCLLLPNV